MGGTGSADAIWKDMQTRGVEFVFAQFVDMYARPSAKLVPGSREPRRPPRGRRGVRRVRGRRDRPDAERPGHRRDPRSGQLHARSWQPNLARFACDVTVEGEEWPYCPRTILRRVIGDAKDKGFEFKMGLELEYFLVRQLEDGSIEIADPRHAREALLRHRRPHPPATTS